jgi:Carboxypeptidase regulatory-like domain
MKCGLYLAVYLLILVLGSQAQDRALITGDATDNQDTPVPGVQVTLRNDSLRVARATTTNADGLYFFAEVVPAEGYVIEASAPGLSFSPPRVKFDVQVGETRHVLPSFLGDKTSSLSSSPQALVRPNPSILLSARCPRRAIEMVPASPIAAIERAPITLVSAAIRSGLVP